MKRLLLSLLMCCVCLTAIAQTTAIRLSLNILPPYSTSLTDYRPSPSSPGKMIATVQNMSNQEQRIYIRAEIRGEENGVRIYTSPDYVPATPIVLSPQETRQLFPHEIMEIYDPNRLVYLGTDQRQIRNSDRVPEGIYSICVRAYDHTPGRTQVPVSQANPAGCTSVFMRNTEPPILIQPFQDAEVRAFQPQNVIFSWTQPAGSDPNTRYRLRIVEMFEADGRRTDPNVIYEASGSPIFNQEITGNTYVYGPADHALVPGRRYAWAVAAVDPDSKTAFRNNGRSEVRAFTYKSYSPEQITINPLVQTEKPKKGGAVSLPGIRFTRDIQIRDLIKNTFKGKLIWAYRKTEAGFVPEPPPAQVKDPHFPGNNTTGAFRFEALETTREFQGNLVSGVSGTNKANSLPTGVSTANTGRIQVFGGGNTTMSLVSTSLAGRAGTSVQSILTARQRHQEKILALADDKRYPLSDTKISLYLRKKQKSGKPAQAAPMIFWVDGKSEKDEILLGQTSTNTAGEFVLNYMDDIPDGYDVYLKIDNPYFEFADYDIPLVAGENGTYDFGELVGLAKTYRVRIKVVNQEGSELELATVRLERTNGFYTGNPTNQNLLHEVMRDSISGQPAEVVAVGKNGSFWPRLFYSQGFTDNYSIIIEGEGILRTIHNLNLIDLSNLGANLSESDQVVLLEKSFVADIPLPVVEGRVLTKNGEVPVAGAVVTVRKKGSQSTQPTRLANGMIGLSVNLNDRSATTDSLGKFTIENIPLNSEAVEVMVNFKGKQTIHDKDLYLSQRGLRETIDPLFINAELITVSGKVVDTNGEPLPDATLTWKTGGKAFYSDEEGNFTGSQTEGKHILIARKPGFRDIEYAVELKAQSKAQGSYQPGRAVNASISSWTQSVNTARLNFKGTGIYDGQTVRPKPSSKPASSSAPTDQKLVQAGTLNNTSKTLTTAAQNYFDVFGDGMPSSSISSGHVIVMSRFFVKVLVKDATNDQPVPNAKVSAEGGTSTSVTNSAGTAIVGDVQGGNGAIIVNGPEGSFYATKKSEVILDASQDTLSVEVSLKAGAKASGRVSLAGVAVADAVVAVEGMEHIFAKTNQQGQYTLSGIPAAEYTLIASKEGFLAGETSRQFSANETYSIDFTLTDPGFNAASLLGFKLVLHRSKPGAAANEFIISGELKNLPDNPVFKNAGNTELSLRFTDKTIVKDGNTIYPKGGELITDVSEIKLKAFNYVAIKLKNPSGIRVRSASAGSRTQGEITGEAEIDWPGTFSAISGIALPSVPLNINTGNTDNTIAPINSMGTASLTALGLAGSIDGWGLYGINLIPDLAASTIDKEGFNLKGKIKIEGIPLLNNQELKLERLVISKRGEIKDVSINLNPAPTLTLITWKLKLTGVNINQYGLKLNGDMEVPIPSSDLAKISVKELGINAQQLTGGTFLLPSTGIDIFGLVKFTTEQGKDFTIQKIAGSTHYRFIGAGSIDLPKWISQRITLDHFSVATNGNFSVVADTDIEVDFADMAKLGITKFGFASNVSQITVGGKFRLNIPMFGAGADGTLYFRKGSAPRIDELGINFNLASAIAVEAKLKFNETEFRGEGALKLAGISGVGLKFWYEKINSTTTAHLNSSRPVNKGIRVGAQFLANVTIPIGLVKLDRLTGGFDFNFAENIYSINAGGRITVAPDPYGVVALDPVALKITSAPGGPVFEGNAGVKVLDAWTLGSATMKLDFNRKQFFIDGEFGAGFSLMKGIDVESKSGVHLELYTGTGSNYWFVAGYSRTRILGIFDTGINIAAGWNVPKSTHTSLSGIPDYVLTSGRLYGGYFGTHSSIDIGPYTATLGPISARAWYKNSGMCEVYANFKSNSFGFKIASDWHAGGHASIAPFGKVASADVRIKGEVEGYYNSRSWGARGHLSGHVRAHIGCEGDCNSLAWKLPWPVPCGLKVCAGAAADVSYDSNKGIGISLRLFE